MCHLIKTKLRPYTYTYSSSESTGSSEDDYIPEFLLVPFSIWNFHFILGVADLQDKITYSCDPYGHMQKTFTDQILRLLCFIHFLDFGKALDVQNWKIINYAALPEFTKQSDGTSCRPFICTMAKSVVFQKKFTSTYFLRTTI